MDAVQIDDSLFVATVNGVDRLDTRTLQRLEWLDIPGETTALLEVEGDLWVGAGSGGVARVRHPNHAERREVVTWGRGGDIVALARAADHLWAADRAGRVLALPLTAESTDSPARLLVDGWPIDLCPWQTGVLVALGHAGSIGLTLADDGSLQEHPMPFTTGPVERLLVDDQVVWWHGDGTLTRLDGGVTSSSSLGDTPTDFDLHPDGLLISAGDAGWLAWSGVHEEAPRPISVDDVADGQPLLATRFASADNGGGWVVSREQGVGRVETMGDPWRLTRWVPYRGAAVSLHAAEDDVVLAVSTASHGEVIQLTIDEGGFAVGERTVIGLALADVLMFDDGFLSAGPSGIGWHPRGETSYGGVQIVDDAVLKSWVLAETPSGDVVTLLWRRGALWLDRPEGGDWHIVAESRLPPGELPIAMWPVAGRYVQTWAEVGMLYEYEEAGSSAGRHRLLDGAAGAAPEGEWLASGALEVDGTLWIGLPSVGLTGVSMAQDETVTLRTNPGAWDVARLGRRLVIARGQAGVAVVDPAKPDAPLVAACDLPGETRRLAVSDDRIVAASGGVMYLLRPPQDL